MNTHQSPFVLACILIGTLAAFARAQEPLTVTTTDSDAVQIVGDFYPPPDQGDAKPPVVILLHMYKTDRSTYAPLIPALNRRGIAALAIDLRGHGKSIQPSSATLAQRIEQRERKVFQDMKYDVQAAYTWLAEQDRVDLTRFGLVGASVGCTVAFKYASEDRSVDVIVALSPGIKYMKLRSLPDIKKIEGRDILLISPEEEIKNAQALKKANESVEIKIVTGTTAEGGNIHGTRMFGNVEGIENFIAGYLYNRLGNPSTETVVSKLKGPIYFPADDKKADRIDAAHKRYYTSAEEAETRGLKKVGTRKRSAMGAVDL